MIIPPQLFEIPKKISFLQVLFCEANKKSLKNFLKKFYNFTTEKFKLIIRRKTRNLKSLFLLKDKDLHPPCKIYKGISVLVNKPMSGGGLCLLSLRIHTSFQIQAPLVLIIARKE